MTIINLYWAYGTSKGKPEIFAATEGMPASRFSRLLSHALPRVDGLPCSRRMA